MKPTLTLGIMSGTSIDGVDYALCAMDEDRLALRELWSVDFPAALRRRLHAVARNGATSWELAQLHHDLGRFYARGARRMPGRYKLQLVGFHGQTVFHNPARGAPATLQIGEPTYLAEELHVPVVSNFRVADLAAGGQGAPLATLFHVRVFGERGRHVCVNNLGGISNVTSIDWRRGVRAKVLAFDTGPANVLVDLTLRHFTGGRKTFDRGGAWAARGAVCEPLLAQWLSHPFLRRRPPKSTGRELFGEPFFAVALREMRRRRLSKFDLAATLTVFTARSLVTNYQRHLPALPDIVVLAGGGAANATMVRQIREALAELNPVIEVMTSDELGWPRQSIEPAAFALLAWLRWNKQPGNLPETTGAQRPVLCGQITEL
jgi:anhydro-N-acetylmuramic acid kinase